MVADANSNDTDKFKLPGSSLEEIFKIIQGYANIGKQASLADVSKNTGLHETSVSRNVGFLISIGILQGRRDKSVTEIGRKLGLALMHDIPDEFNSIMSEVVSQNEFLKNILAAVRIRKGMDLSSLRAHIAYSAGLSKTGSTTTGTSAVVDLLKRSGNLRLEDGKLVVSSPIPRTVSIDSVSINNPSEPLVLKSSVHGISSSVPIAISIKIEVKCDAQDLGDLGSKLRKVMDDFSGKNWPSEGSED